MVFIYKSLLGLWMSSWWQHKLHEKAQVIISHWLSWQECVHTQAGTSPLAPSVHSAGSTTQPDMVYIQPLQSGASHCSRCHWDSGMVCVRLEDSTGQQDIGSDWTQLSLLHNRSPDHMGLWAQWCQLLHSSNLQTNNNHRHDTVKMNLLFCNYCCLGRQRLIW